MLRILGRGLPGSRLPGTLTVRSRRTAVTSAARHTSLSSGRLRGAGCKCYFSDQLAGIGGLYLAQKSLAASICAGVAPMYANTT